MMDDPVAYLDTCVIGGLATGELSEADEEAVLKILQASSRGEASVITSEVTKATVAGISKPNQSRHELIYNLLEDVPTARTHKTHLRTLLGVGGERHPDPLVASLTDVLPDGADVRHLFQAVKNGASWFVTADERPAVRLRGAVADLCGVQVMTPVQCIAWLESVL